MTDGIKHECGIALIRLLKPLEHYQLKYGTWRWGLNKLYLLMEKQHNRGQDGGKCDTQHPEGHDNRYVLQEDDLGQDQYEKTGGVCGNTSHVRHNHRPHCFITSLDLVIMRIVQLLEIPMGNLDGVADFSSAH